MARRRGWFVLTVLAAALVVLGLGWRHYDRENVGIPNFYLWKALSGKAHGGQRASLNGVTIYYETYGQGRPVLVLHGGTAFIETMHYQITDLARDHRVIAPDSRGHGRSGDGPGPLHYAEMAGDMIALMDRLHIAKADVVGWSDGGIVALDLAMKHPDRIGRVVTMGANFNVAGLVDAGPTPGPDSPEVVGRRDFYRSVAPDPGHWPVFYGKVVQMWRTEPDYSLADLGRIRSPVLVMAGEHDGIRREHTDALAQAIPGAGEAIIPNTSHMAPLEDPKSVDAAIRVFLGG